LKEIDQSEFLAWWVVAFNATVLSARRRHDASCNGRHALLRVLPCGLLQSLPLDELDDFFFLQGIQSVTRTLLAGRPERVDRLPHSASRVEVEPLVRRP